MRSTENFHIQVVVPNCADYLLNSIAIHSPPGKIPKLFEIRTGLEDSVEGGNSEVGCFVDIQTLEQQTGRRELNGQSSREVAVV